MEKDLKFLLQDKSLEQARKDLTHYAMYNIISCVAYHLCSFWIFGQVASYYKRKIFYGYIS